MRFTSPSHDLIAQIGELYGGEAQQWERKNSRNEVVDTQWQVYIDREEIDIIVPPGDSLTTSYEIWSAAGMQKYCDGEVMKIPGSDEEHYCECKSLIADGKGRACKIKARMLVWLPRIQTLGVWRLETGSWYAAGELTKMVDLLLDASNRMQKAVGAKLRLDKRTVKREGKTFNFNVPIITPVGDVAVVLEASTPMTALPEARDVSLRPDAPVALPAPATTEWPSDAPENLEGHEPSEDDEPLPVAREGDVPGETATINEGKHKQLMITMRAVNLTDDERHDLVRHVTGGRTESSLELTNGDMPVMWERLTARATIEVQKLFGVLWPNPTVGWENLHAVKGLEDKVNEWKLNEWLIALDHCELSIEAMNESSEPDTA